MVLTVRLATQSWTSQARVEGIASAELSADYIKRELLPSRRPASPTRTSRSRTPSPVRPAPQPPGPPEPLLDSARDSAAGERVMEVREGKQKNSGDTFQY